MIEIIKHGDSRMKMECPKCHCVFVYTDNEVVRTRFENLAPVVICPECTYNIDPIYAEPLINEEK